MHHYFDDHDFGSGEHQHHEDLFGHQYQHAGDSHHAGIDDSWHHLADPMHSDPIHDDGTHSHHLLDHSSITGDQTLGSVVETHYPHFNPSYIGPGIIGDPGHDITHWHQQLYDNTCAVASQEFILESFGFHISEDALRQEAITHGWYTTHGGTPVAYVGDLLASHGIPIERHYGATMAELADKLSHNQKVIVGVNGEDIWFHGSPNDPLAHYPGIPGQNADHAVEVIGINNADPSHPYVILNDPGTADGQGIAIPMGVFENAWATSQHFMVATAPIGPLVSANMAEGGTTLGGYSNADGTYHYESDNTDRDPDTGVIVRRW